LSDTPAKNEEGKLLIPDDILAALEVVRSSGLVNMVDRKGIKELVPDEVGQWMDDNEEIYMEGFFVGFSGNGTNYMS
tara:strand:+ start:187 stop:417 length:231 start_codon:yes stop_codon:yes gene_type:complete